MIERIFDGQEIRFISDEHKKQYFEGLGLKSGTGAYKKLHAAMEQSIIRIDSVIEGCVDRVNGVTMTYNPILPSDFVYFEEVSNGKYDKIMTKIRDAFRIGKESEILELTLNEILEK